MSDFNPQLCEITKAEISRYDTNTRDITALITQTIITQSLEDVAWRGEVEVLDTVGLLDKFGLRGEETFRLELKSEDLGTVRRLDAQIIKIDNIMQLSDGSGHTYKMHFISKTSFDASLRKIIRPFKNVTTGFAAETVFKEYFGDIAPAKGTNQNENKEVLAFETKKYTLARNDRQVYLQPTIGQIKAVIPNYTPQRTMTFLASRSYSSDSVSSTYRFFETLTSYYFVTDEFLMKRGTDNPKQIRQMSYGAFASREPDQPLEQISTFTSIQDKVRVNTPRDMMGGGYKSVSYEINLLDKMVKEVTYDYGEQGKYISANGKHRSITDDTHSSEFIKDTFTKENAARFIIYRDYRAPDEDAGILRTDQHYSQSYANRMSHSHHMSAITVQASIAGRLDLEPGTIINLDILSASSSEEEEQDDRLSGNYLITATNHALIGDKLETSMQMVKYV